MGFQVVMCSFGYDIIIYDVMPFFNDFSVFTCFNLFDYFPLSPIETPAYTR